VVKNSLRGPVLASAFVRPDELERRLRERLDALGPMGRHALLKVLLMPDAERADIIGQIWSDQRSRTLANC
jgi:hypothetical protein